MMSVKSDNKKYVIRSYQFGYNDECLYVEGNRIKSIFTDKETAEKQYKKLEIKAARAFILNDVEEFFDGDDKALKACSKLVMETCGIQILDDSGYLKSGTELPEEMSNDDVLKFVDIADMHSYQLLAFDINQTFYAIWLPKKNSYYMLPSEDMDYFLYEKSKVEIMKTISDLAEDTKWDHVTIRGSLEEISHTPVLLEKLIAQEKKLSYSGKNLKLSGIKSVAYKALNELLLKPLFEIKELSLDEVMKIEKKQREDFMRENGWDE